MKLKTYVLSSQLPAEAASERVGDLLARAAVQYKTEGLSIVSTGTPVVFVSVQRNLYSNRNWVGLNPFAFISGVDVRCRSGETGLTDVIVQVNKARTFLWVAFFFLISGLVAPAMPNLFEAVLFIVTVGLTTSFAL